jgi:TetR/AcrR family transcriptional regulator, transcriptional repressor for nem operon
MGRTSNTRARLIRSAIELMCAKGYNQVGLQELCNHAGAKKGSFYYFFDTKRDVVLAALEKMWESTERLVLRPAYATNRAPLARIQRHFELAYEHQRMVHASTGTVLGCRFGNLAAEMSVQDEAVRRRIAEIFAAVEGYIEGALRDAVAAGDAQDMDTAGTAKATLAYLEGALLLARTENDPAVLRQLAAGATQLALTG